jgi:hypothetical protein
MRRKVALLAAVFVGALLMAAAEARAQLVPISQCGSAIPCNIPTGLRPADAAALSPNGRPSGGNALIGMQLNPAEGFKPEIVTREIAEDPSDRAARIFVKRNPGFAMPRTEKAPAPQPAAQTAPAAAPTPPPTPAANKKS